MSKDMEIAKEISRQTHWREKEQTIIVITLQIHRRHFSRRFFSRCLISDMQRNVFICLGCTDIVVSK